MADDSQAAFLAQLFGGSTTGADTADITSFRNTVAQNDPWTMAAAPIMNAKFNTQTWSPYETMGVSAAQGFLGAILKGLGQQNQAEQLGKLATVLPSLYEDPSATFAPEGMDQEAFNALKLGVMARDTKGTAAAKAKWAQALFDVKLEGQKAEAQALGKIKGESKGYGYGAEGTANPDDPREKKTTDLRTRFENLEEVQNFKYVQRLATQLTETMKNPSAVADPALAKMAVQFIEPHLSTTSGETGALAGSSSIPDAWKADIQKALKGGSGLSPTVRQGLLNLADSAYKAHGKAFAQTYNLYNSEADRFGIPIDRITKLGLPTSFADFTGAKTLIPVTNPKNGKTIMVPSDDPRLEQLKALSQRSATSGGTPYG